MARLQSLSTTTNPSGSDAGRSAETLAETVETPSTSVTTATEPIATTETESSASPVTERRKPLLFDPEPTQRMVVVRRRKRRRSKKVNKAEQAAGHARLMMFGLVIILLLVAVSGQHFAQALLEQLKDILRPLKTLIRAPKMEVVALVIAALVLIYMMPGVESTIKRWLGITSRPKQKTR